MTPARGGPKAATSMTPGSAHPSNFTHVKQPFEPAELGPESSRILGVAADHKALIRSFVRKGVDTRALQPRRLRNSGIFRSPT